MNYESLDHEHSVGLNASDTDMPGTTMIGYDNDQITTTPGVQFIQYTDDDEEDSMLIPATNSKVTYQ